MDGIDRFSSNWFPGHMKKARFLISKNLKNVDIVFELLDSRAPFATRNRQIFDITKNKLRLVVLGKCDLAENSKTKIWIDYFKKKEDVFAVSLNCKNFKQAKEIINISQRLIKELYIKRNKKNILNKKFRAMVVGVPNVGKSTLINSLAGRKKAKTGNFPGITISEQWVVVAEKVDLLDTPGNLSFEDKGGENGFILELIGSIKSGNFDEEDVAFNFLKFLKENKEEVLNKIFNYKNIELDENLLEKYGRMKSMLKKGAIVDIQRAAKALIKEFREGKFGAITLQLPKI